VEEVLHELGALDEAGGRPFIEALNKADALPEEVRATLETRTATGAERARQYPVSALTGEGVERLLNAIADLLGAAGEAREVSVPLADGATIAWLYRHGEVRSRRDEGDTAWLTVALDAAAAAQFERRQMAR
jgi:GTP-binding protein HflX